METAKEIVIFDIDGTLADVEGRVHHIQGRKRTGGPFSRKCTPIRRLIPLCHFTKNFGNIRITKSIS